MLRLTKIVKIYKVADLKVEALKGINLAFRKNEFVSILGPSGCGKTTMLNIIGGLDQYTSGDLIINGKSTKSFNEHDWDVYRNHRIGFVFQSYNLIPHQTILGNVELALTIAGLSKEVRQKKAKEALDKVGLKGLYNKKPNQLSGGQCQRVAIARALVNEPDILLADEPTGALDTETSIQIMDLIKEISKDKLVIMVTHNPDLAKAYSTRIVRLLDGRIIEDSNPFTIEDEIKEVEETNKINANLSLAEKKAKQKSEKAKMSWWTSFKLSARNLSSKAKRTILTCIAGSIGIVGISAVLAVSSGVKGYIVSMQDDMLSGNPITIEETALDLNALMSNMTTSEKLEVVENAVNVESLLEFISKNLVGDNATIVTNDIDENYIAYLNSMPQEYYNVMTYDYGINLSNNIYTDFKINDKTTENPSLTVIKSMYQSLLMTQDDYREFASMIMSLGNTMSQVLPNEDYVMSQYELLDGKFPTSENELLLVVSDDQAITDLTLAQLGYYSQEEFLSLAMTPDAEDNKMRFSFEELKNKSFYYYPNDSVFESINDGNPMLKIQHPFKYNSYKDEITTGQPVELKVVGVIKPKDDLYYGCLKSGFYYTEALSKRMLADSKNSEIIEFAIENSNDDGNFNFGVKGQIEDPTTGKPVSINLYNIDYTYRYYDIDGNVVESDVTCLPGSTSSTSLMSQFMSNISVSGPSMRELGGKELPNFISIYPLSFEEKNLVTDYLDAWNNDGDVTFTKDGSNVTLTKEERLNQIKYTDSMELIITIINGLIDIVTIALICFTALSLVVSCVMIAIITYVSVMERVKEIGVIRSLGGRKKDVSNLFNAETMMTGLASGLVGIVITYIIQIVANIIVYQVAGIYPIAALPWWQALIMVLVSVLLNAISGFIPARGAAKKDPAQALRTE